MQIRDQRVAADLEQPAPLGVEDTRRVGEDHGSVIGEGDVGTAAAVGDRLVAVANHSVGQSRRCRQNQHAKRSRDTSGNECSLHRPVEIRLPGVGAAGAPRGPGPKLEQSLLRETVTGIIGPGACAASNAYALSAHRNAVLCDVTGTSGIVEKGATTCTVSRRRAACLTDVRRRPAPSRQAGQMSKHERRKSFRRHRARRSRARSRPAIAMKSRARSKRRLF